MKIAFFTYTRLEYGGGVAKYFTEISTGLMRRYKDIKIDIVTFDEKTLKILLFFYFIYFTGNQDMDQADKEKIENIKRSLGKVNYIKVPLFGLKELLNKYDLVYTTNNLLEVVLFKYIIGYSNLPPIVYGFHIPMFYELADSIQSKIHNYLYKSILYKYALKNARKLHVMNDFDENLLKNNFQNEKIFKVYYPFNFQDFTNRKTKFRYSYVWSKKLLNIVWIGRLTEQKGVKVLSGLINKLNNKLGINKFIWNIFGDGELKEEVINLSKKWSNVIYHGYVQNRYIPDVLNNNDIFISTSKWESFPYNLLEAQAIGLPVICFNVHGCSDIIDNRKNGYLVNNISEYNLALEKIFKKNLLSKEKIQSYISKKFDYEEIYSQMYKLLTYD